MILNQWKPYEVHERDNDDKIRAGPCTIEAPSPGVAIEYFSAIHGLMSYDNVFIRDGLDAIPDEPAAKVLALMSNAGKWADELDAHHRWQWLHSV